jgi:hypothetical protein
MPPPGADKFGWFAVIGGVENAKSPGFYNLRPSTTYF